MTSCWVRRQSRARSRALASSVLLECMTHFGRPVVPDEDFRGQMYPALCFIKYFLYHNRSTNTQNLDGCGQQDRCFLARFLKLEHESNHNGQIKFLKKRIPGAKPDSE